MSTSPAATPVTVPSLLTVAIVVFEDDHAACVVTLWLALFDSVAVATNCAVAPTTGEVPLTTTADTVTVEPEGLVGAPDSCPQPLTETIIAKAAAIRNCRPIRCHRRNRKSPSRGGCPKRRY